MFGLLFVLPWNLYSSQVHFHQVRQSCQALYLRCFPESNERAVLAVCGGADALPGEHETRLHNGIGCIESLLYSSGFFVSSGKLSL